LQSRKYNLTEGPILKRLVTLSVPIVATSVFQLAFNMSDMFWLSRLSEGSVAAAGTAGMYLWLSMALIMIGRMGAEIGVSQNMGRGEPDTARSFAQQSLMISIVLGVLFSVSVILLREPLIGFFNIDDPTVVHEAEQYLMFTVMALPFMFINNVITGIFNGFGNTKLPFYINSATLAINIAATPIFIFTLDMGIVGAAIATIIATAVNLVCKIWALTKYKNRPFEGFKLINRADWMRIRQIFKWGIPIAIESALFTLLFMVVARLVADFGVDAIAAQRVGSQVESLSWMMAGGFASAVTAFIGQNYGAKKYARLAQGYKISLIAMLIYGVFVTLVLFIFARPLVSIFLTEQTTIDIGVNYLRIFALTQTLSCMSGIASGSFRGQGQTVKPTIVTVSGNVLRVILAYTLAATRLGLDGVWIGIAISVTVGHIWLLLWYRRIAKRMPKVDFEPDVDAEAKTEEVLT